MLSDEAWLAIARDVGRAQFSVKASVTLGIPFQDLGGCAAPSSPSQTTSTLLRV